MIVSEERMKELIEIIRSGDRLAFYSSKEWKHVRALVKDRDNNECQDCKAQGKVFTDASAPDKRKRLEVDHVKEIETYPELCLDMSNMRLLCIRCHNAKHERYHAAKTKWDDERW